MLLKLIFALFRYMALGGTTFLYQPASVLTSTAGLSHLSSIYYDRVGVENLKANLPFVATTSRRKLPDRNGRTIQLYSYDLLGAATTPGTEGTVGTGENPTTSIRNVTVQQYFNFASFSDILVETAIDPIVENTAAEMGYQAALTSNVLARTEYEAEALATSAIVISCTDNEFLSASLVRQAAMSLRNQDVRPQSDGMFVGVISPAPAFDLLNDNTAGGVIDILKYHREGAEELMRGVQAYRVIDIGGVRFIETTTASTFSGFPVVRQNRIWNLRHWTGRRVQRFAGRDGNSRTAQFPDHGTELGAFGC
jgi:N4-gp56 family major capsid protein